MQPPDFTDDNQITDQDAAAPAWITRELIDRTIRVWGPYYREPLAPGDAIAIITSVSRLLKELS